MIQWNELKYLSEAERKMLEKVSGGGTGAKLPEEDILQFSIGKEEKFEIDTEAGKVRAFYYRPKNSERETLPLYINAHGGGFVKGRRDQDTRLCRNYCSRAHVAVLDVDYLPAPAVRYPGQLYQMYGVMQYCLDPIHAKELDIDPTRVMVGGHSAGGSLTIGAMLMAVDRGGRLPKAQFLDYAPLDMVTPTREKRNGIDNPVLPPELSDFFIKMYIDEDLVKEPYATPLNATDEQLRGLPETMIFYCDSDVFCDEAALFTARLLKVGIPVFAKCFMHSNHAFVVRRNGEYEIAEKYIIRALKNL